MFKSTLKASAFVVLLLAIFSCSKKSDNTPAYTIDASTIALHYDETHQFVITQGSITPAANTFTWTSSDPTVGTVSTDGVFTGKKIGTTTITAVGSGTTLKSDVTVTPYSTLCAEPYFDVTASAAITKTKEKRTLISGDNSNLLYAGENAKLKNVSYIYNSNSLMSSAALVFTNTPDVIAEAGKFFKERYTYYGNDTGSDFYTDGKNVTIGVGTDPDLGFYAIYIPYATQNVAPASVKTLTARAVKTTLSNLKQIR